MCPLAKLCHECYGVSNHLLIIFESCSTRRNHAWYLKPSQESVAGEILGPRREPTWIYWLFCYKNISPNCLLNTYVYVHWIVLPSAFIREASCCSGQWLVQTQWLKINDHCMLRFKGNVCVFSYMTQGTLLSKKNVRARIREVCFKNMSSWYDMTIVKWTHYSYHYLYKICTRLGLSPIYHR